VLAAAHSAPEDLLRQLNVTARYQDKPPIMFRVAFAPAPEEPPAAVAVTPETAAPMPVATTSADAHAAPLASTPAPSVPVPTPAKPDAAPLAPTPAPAPAVAAAKPAPTINISPALAPPSAPVASKIPEANAAPKSTRDDLGLHALDREEARLAAITPPLAPLKRDVKAMPGTALGPSAETPPDPVLAMVWKPAVFEALPESAPEQKNYDVVEFARLGGFIGRYVQVITEGGKKIGGLVLGVDDAGVRLQVNRDGGNITFVVTKTRVQEIRLPHY